MTELSRRTVLTAAAGAAGGVGVAACGKSAPSTSQEGARGGSKEHTGQPAGKKKRVRLIGDGSTADTGPQPHQPTPRRMRPGETPPQFVVFSWDGAGVAKGNLFRRFRELANQHNAAMTFFLSGLYLLPESKKKLYHPPHRPPGSSAIEFLSDEHIHATIKELSQAWRDGHEIGTHFNGHFCGPTGVSSWSPEDWDSEIDQAVRFVQTWKTNTGFTDLPPLPFDYRKELVGGRTPCLEGQHNLLPTARERGWRYDASAPGGKQRWPGERQGLWNLPLQAIPFKGHSFDVLSMDYNFMANQSDGDPKGNRAHRDSWRRQTRDSYVAGFRRAQNSNRAPFFIGNHLEHWNGGIYMDAVEDALVKIASEGDVRMVSFRQFTEWLDAQDPAVLRRLRTLPVGQKPKDGWERLLDTSARTT